MHFVSGLPPSGVLAASHREPVAETLRPVAPTPPAGPTVLTSAVTQAESAEQAAASVLRRASSQQDQRARMVGPHPAFAVNLLQHLRETQFAPDDSATTPKPKLLAPTGHDSTGQTAVPLHADSGTAESVRADQPETLSEPSDRLAVGGDESAGQPPDGAQPDSATPDTAPSAPPDYHSALSVWSAHPESARLAAQLDKAL
jgi:hypothetical protein